MIDRYLSIWEIAHRWRDVNPDKSDPTDLPLNVQDTIRYICRGVLDGKLSLFELDVGDFTGKEELGGWECVEMVRKYAPRPSNTGGYRYMGQQSIRKNHILLLEKIIGSSPDRGANLNSKADCPLLAIVNVRNVSGAVLGE